jgi:hypothetical protein
MTYLETDGDGKLLLKPLPHINVNQLIREWKLYHMNNERRPNHCYLVLTHLKDMQWWEIKQYICMGEVVVLRHLLCAS